MTIKIASFNANSIRARLSIIIEWLVSTSTEILCVQETKVQDGDFPEEAFEEIGYHCGFKGQKSYNGVALISKFPLENLSSGFDRKGEDEGARLMTARINNINILNVYIPQGFAPETEKFQYKLTWLERLLEYLNNNFTREDPLILLGDFNIAPENIDVYDPEKLSGSVGFHPDEQKGLQKIRDWGFVDVFRKHEKREKQYTFFDYRIPNGVKRNMGWRIDHIWATEVIAEKSVNSYIDLKPRLKDKPSDHTCIIAEFDVEW
ncbi:MAG TPA: exodeoxyribonuclease III [Candidatus Eremiobacteraeota bacterium]|nr:exodeoxyribonuclease III [Candidatus Eremiobacteraeota bacterium]